MMRLTLAAITIMIASEAGAQVPIGDAARLKEEDKTARCMLRSRTYKENTLQPTKEVKGSVASPQSGSGSMNAGTSYAIGPGQTSGVVNGVDVGALIGGAMGVINAVQGKNYAAMAQSIGALAAVIEANTQGFNQGKQQIGSINSLHGAWDQNSQARIGTVGVWGQTIQAGSIRLQFENDKLLRLLEEASQRQKALTFDPSTVRLVDDLTPPQRPN